MLMYIGMGTICTYVDATKLPLVCDEISQTISSTSKYWIMLSRVHKPIQGAASTCTCSLLAKSHRIHMYCTIMQIHFYSGIDFTLTQAW